MIFPSRMTRAATAKPDTMIRSRGSAGYTSHTFAELSQVAQHWNDVLGFDRALMTLGGWIRMGFDNQYPDILPASPEAGGNEGLAALSTQVRDYGWLSLVFMARINRTVIVPLSEKQDAAV